MKKHKSVISILLAIMMVFTFMPTLAFAETANGEFNANHQSSWTAAEKKDGKVLVDPTCYAPGIVEVGCNKDGGICTHKAVVEVPTLTHDYVDKRFDTAAEFAAELVNQGEITQKEALTWLAGAGADVCYGYAKVCSICGAFENTSGPLYGLTATEHKEPGGTKACATSFKCQLCDKEGAINSTHNPDYSAAYHANPANLTSKTLDGRYCQKTVTIAYGGAHYDVNAWETVTTKTCNECKKVVSKTHTIHDDGGYGVTIADSELAHNMVKTTVVEATCDHEGLEVQTCSNCGYEGPSQAVLPKEHDYSDVISFPATLYDAAATVKACKFCGDIDWSTYKETGKPLKASYTLNVLWPKNCDVAGIVTVTRQVEGRADLTITDYLTYDRGTKKYEWFDGTSLSSGQIYSTDKDYFCGFGGELAKADAVEIPDIIPTGHKWAKSDKVAEASCLMPELEAMKCTICGDIKHDATRVGKALGHEVEEVVVQATCGEAGYTYKICTRCNQYLDKNGKTAVELDPLAKPFKEPQKYNETAPVVKLGEKCTYEWKVLEEPTYFKKGTRAKVCTVCNHLEEATKESIAEKKIAAPKVKALKKKAKVTVKAVDGAVKYQIVVNGKVVKKNAKAGKTYTIKKKNLKLGKKNKFQIRAYDAKGVKATSKAKNVKIKKK